MINCFSLAFLDDFRKQGPVCEIKAFGLAVIFKADPPRKSLQESQMMGGSLGWTLGSTALCPYISRNRVLTI